jgi:hypothetical protein
MKYGIVKDMQGTWEDECTYMMSEINRPNTDPRMIIKNFKENIFKSADSKSLTETFEGALIYMWVP